MFTYIPILETEFVNKSHLNFMKNAQHWHGLVIDSVEEQTISYNLQFRYREEETPFEKNQNNY